MASQPLEKARSELLRWLDRSTAASGVPLTVEDEATLLEVVRRLNEC